MHLRHVNREQHIGIGNNRSNGGMIGRDYCFIRNDNEYVKRTEDKYTPHEKAK